MRLRWLVAALILSPAALAAADEFDGTPTLSTDDKAKIEAEREEARKAVDEKYKDDNSAEARRAKQEGYRDADRDVLEKHKLSERDYSWQNSHNSPAEQREIREESKSIQEKHKAEAEAKKNAKKDDQEIEIVRGFNDANPLDMSVSKKDAKEKQPPKLDEEGNPIPEVVKLDPKDDPNAMPAAGSMQMVDGSSGAATPAKNGGGAGGRHHRKGRGE